MNEPKQVERNLKMQRIVIMENKLFLERKHRSGWKTETLLKKEKKKKR